MNRLKYKLLYNWSVMRAIRLGLGAWMLFAALQNADYGFAAIGAFFFISALSNTGCCATGNCYVPQPINLHMETEQIDSPKK